MFIITFLKQIFFLMSRPALLKINPQVLIIESITTKGKVIWLYNNINVYAFNII